MDKTGASGLYDVSLRWSADGGQPDLAGGNVTPPTDPSAVTIFNAIHDQLGLRLNSEKGPALTNPSHVHVVAWL
jgi:uncharacterized protein (TIGR03435 family)